MRVLYTDSSALHVRYFHLSFLMQAIKDVHLFVSVMILVALDIIIIGVYLLSSGVTGNLGAVLTYSRENPIDIFGVCW